MPGRILERDHELHELAAAARAARNGAGSVVLVAGEPGIGKSSLVAALRPVLPAEARLLVGYCDDLATPRVLGPLRDLAGRVGTKLAAALESGDRGRVIDALRAELDWPDHPTVLAVEDVHWADEATLDVLRYLVRRLAGMPVVLVLTYRDGELGPDGPLRQLIGLAATTPGVRRLDLARLSPDAVRRLGADSGIDTDAVYAVTAGNPFFVTEVLAGGDPGGVPPTIAEAVRARLAGLDAATRDALERLAVVPSTVERWLVDAVVPGGLPALAAAEQRGVLTVTSARVAFRHELTRRAVVDTMPAARRDECHRLVLAALLARPEGEDLSRIMHHAAEVGDDAVIVAIGPAAAGDAVVAGAHREAVAHYRLVLERRAAYPATRRAELLEAYAVECYTMGLAEPATLAQEEAVALRRAGADPAALGSALRWLSRISWWAGQRVAADAAGAEAIALLESTGDRPALTLALSNRAQLLALAGRDGESVALGERVVAMARAEGDPALITHALNNLGLATWTDDPARGRALLAESLAVALDAGELDHACRAYANLAWELLDDRRLDEAEQVLREGVEVAEPAEFLGFVRYLHIELGLVALGRGRWAAAEREANWAAVEERLDCVRSPGLYVLARIAVRRGSRDAGEILAVAWRVARQLDEAQRIAPVASVLAEAAWLRGDPGTIRTVVAPLYDDIRRAGERWHGAELAYWLHLAGAPVPFADPTHPYALMAAGRAGEAAAIWAHEGFPYERALALAGSTEPTDLLAALAVLDRLDAEPLARVVRGRLKELGVARIPRRATPTTRDNPGRLTGRQVDVVRLLAAGLSNAEIAQRLVLSVRTVDSHVAAVLDKLDAATRQDAVARARAIGALT